MSFDKKSLSLIIAVLSVIGAFKSFRAATGKGAKMKATLGLASSAAFAAKAIQAQRESQRQTV